MVIQFDNDESRAAPAKENFALELLELHMPGVDTYINEGPSRWSDVPIGADGVAVVYINEDVYEVARP